MIDGEYFKKFVCADCKEKIVEETKKLGWRAKAFPTLYSKKFAKMICKKCRKKLIKAIKEKGR